MDNKNNRRGFLRKLALGVSGAVLGTKSVLANSEGDLIKVDVKNIQPLGFQWETRDPFLFCVHHEDFYPKGNEALGPNASLSGRRIGQDFLVKDGWRMYHGSKVPGFPGHPHRGFETVTVVRKGMVDHSDSMGASGRYGDGDVQWMTAGKGVQHAEMFPLLNKDQDNPLELFQIWLNLPRKNKFVEPHFKMLWRETIPVIKQKDKNGKMVHVEVIAGELNGKNPPAPPPNSWANPSEHEVAIWNIAMEHGAEFELPSCASDVNRTIYFYEGDELLVSGKKLPHYHSAEVDGGASIKIKTTNSKANVLILQGKPISEPVVQHGPFVMNSRQEIQQAFRDYQTTQFGGWPWPVNDPTHGNEKKRFAAHADGRREEKS